jgi:KaiC/GvpD/RAD55 family RecA-like ATPase
MEFPFYEAQLRQQYRLLQHNGGWTQVHCHNTVTKRVESRELLYGEEKVIEWAKEVNGTGNVFLGRALRNEQGVVRGSSCLSLDLDPIRDRDTAATDTQHKVACDAGRQILRELKYGVLASSGNGALLLFPLGRFFPKDEVESMGKALEAKARGLLGSFSSQVTVDHTHDCARLAKAMGCVSTKGDQRLWRHARFIDSPLQLRSPEAFLKGLEDFKEAIPERSVLPEIDKGSLDRSKADIALAARLKIQGFGPQDTYKALCSYATRPGREDDYKRIVEKIYHYGPYKQGNTLVQEPPKAIELWTPENGAVGYLERHTGGSPELPTGFREIDNATFGLIRGHLFTVGARTNCGKTTFAVNVAQNLCKSGRTVVFVSTESTYQEIWDRYFAIGTNISAFKLQNRNLSPEELDRLRAFEREFKNHKLAVYDGSRPNMGLIRQVVEQAKPDVLVFDYFQHVEARETRELEEFVMQLKDLAKKTSTAVLMCAQLHDRYDMKTGKQSKPTLADMKNSKVLNDESRVVLLLDWDRDNATSDGPAAVKVLMAKNKGARADCVLRLDRTVPKFTEEKD